jgi:hypothetical protein
MTLDVQQNVGVRVRLIGVFVGLAAAGCGTNEPATAPPTLAGTSTMPSAVPALTVTPSPASSPLQSRDSGAVSGTASSLAAVPGTIESVSTATLSRPTPPPGSPRPPASSPPRTLQDPDAEGCLGAPVVELVRDRDRVEMDLIYYQEISATCGYNADGDAMFDDAFHPATALDALDGELAIATGFQAAVSIDIRPFKPPVRLAAISTSPDILAAASDGTYPVALPGNGCFVVTVAWSVDITETSGREGKYTGLSETQPGACDF